MARKTEERDYFNLYSFDEEKNNKSKKRKVNNKKDKKVKNNKSDNKFSFDNEIVIGVTKIQEKKDVSKVKNNKTIKSKKKIDKKSKIKKGKNENQKEKNKKVELEVKEKKSNNQNDKEKKNKLKSNKKVKQEKEKKIRKEILTPEEYEKREKNKKRNLHIIKYVMILALIIGVVLCAMFSPLFNIKDIIVEGNDTISKDQILSLSKIQLGNNSFKLSKEKIKKQIKENPYIDEVNITRKLPSTIILSITERKPAYLIEYASGYAYVDKKGYILQISEDKLELPILQGTETILNEDSLEGKRLCIEDLNKLSIILNIMQIATDNDIQTLITRIDIDNEKNIKIIFETEGKTAYIGDDENLNIKILTIKEILEKTQGESGEILVNMDLNKEYPVFRERV